MPMPNWTTNEAVTDTNFNEMIDVIPSSVCLVITPSGTPFLGRTGVSNALVATLRLRPVQGRYLHIRHEVKSTDGNAAFFQYVVRHSSGSVAVFFDSSITSTSYARGRETVDMENLTIHFQPVDATGTDCELLLYVNDKASIRSVQIYTGEGSADTDYGAL